MLDYVWNELKKDYDLIDIDVEKTRFLLEKDPESIPEYPQIGVRKDIIFNNPLSNNNLNPIDGLSVSKILLISSEILSIETILIRFLFLEMASNDTCSILKFN